MAEIKSVSFLQDRIDYVYKHLPQNTEYESGVKYDLVFHMLEWMYAMLVMGMRPAPSVDMENFVKKYINGGKSCDEDDDDGWIGAEYDGAFDPYYVYETIENAGITIYVGCTEDVPDMELPTDIEQEVLNYVSEVETAFILFHEKEFEPPANLIPVFDRAHGYTRKVYGKDVYHILSGGASEYDSRFCDVTFLSPAYVLYVWERKMNKRR